MSTPEVDAWGADLVARGVTVLHKRTLVVGKVVKYYDGETERSGNCFAPVVELEEGHTFVAQPEKFVELDAQAVRFYSGIVQGLAAIVKVAARTAPTLGSARGIDLTVAALRAQLAALEAGGE
jgi:hypothetical protein